jgi:hypothetical protein
MKGFFFGIMLRPTFLSFDHYIGISVNNFIWLSFSACLIALAAFLSSDFTAYQFYITGGLVIIASSISFSFLKAKNHEVPFE